MPDIPAGHRDLAADTPLYTLKDAAALTGRPYELIRRWTASGEIPSVTDPLRKNGRLLGLAAVGAIAARPARGRHRRAVTLTWSDGHTTQIVAPVRDR